METTVGQGKEVKFGGNVDEYRKGVRNLIEAEVKNVIDEEMRKAAQDLMEEQRRAIRQTVEEQKIVKTSQIVLIR